MALRLRRQVAVSGVRHKDGTFHDDEILQIPIATDREDIVPEHLKQIPVEDFVDTSD